MNFTDLADITELRLKEEKTDKEKRKVCAYEYKLQKRQVAEINSRIYELEEKRRLIDSLSLLARCEQYEINYNSVRALTKFGA